MNRLKENETVIYENKLNVLGVCTIGYIKQWICRRHLG